MKISYYCQHVLGIGHLHRSLEICRAIADEHEVTLILGGPPVDMTSAGIDIFHLPGLKMDQEFQQITPCAAGASLEDIKQQRKNLLISHFMEYQPDLFITELYPFGRKAFRFELDPVLAGLRDGTLPPCRCYCSVRDILVEKQQGRGKFEQRVVETLNRSFDGVLIHADPSVITLDETFSRMTDISIPIYYTGFVSTPHVPSSHNPIRNKLRIAEDTQLIVASIGGGTVGGELLRAVLRACTLFDEDFQFHLQLFCGPYSDQKLYEDLKKQRSKNISVDIFTDIFPEWLDTADLSISMGGYNTCMNLLLAGVPALVYPFRQNREQKMRGLTLEKKSNIRLLTENELSPEILIERIEKMLLYPRTPTTINLNGAGQTVQQLNSWWKDSRNE